jgi:predicted nucleic acid-binding protein
MGGVTETEVSVVTLAELTVGVLMASNADRPTRVATLSAVESTWEPLRSTPRWPRQFVHILPPCGRTGGVPILDALVAATAVVEQIRGVEVICV